MPPPRLPVNIVICASVCVDWLLLHYWHKSKFPPGTGVEARIQALQNDAIHGWVEVGKALAIILDEGDHNGQESLDGCIILSGHHVLGSLLGLKLCQLDPQAGGGLHIIL